MIRFFKKETYTPYLTQNSNYLDKEENSYAKGWAILIMIFLHTFGSRSENFHNEIIGIVEIGEKPLVIYLSSFCSICVYLFIMISGYGLYVCNRSRVDFKKLYRLFLKIIFIAILFYPWAIYNHDLNWEFTFPQNMGALFGIGYNAEWWFIRPYIIIYVLSPFIIRFYREKPICCVLISLILYVIGKIMAHFQESIISSTLISVMILTLPFIGGCLLAGSNVLSAKIFKKNFWLVLIAGVCVIFKSLFPYGIFDAFIALIIYIIILKVKVSNPIKLHITKYGHHATSMWLTHSFFILYYFPNVFFNLHYPVVIFVAVLIVTYLTSYIIDTLFSKL